MNEQQLAAVKLALEALEYIDNNYMSLPKSGNEAITALQSIIEQSAPETGSWYAAKEIDEMARDLDAAMNGDCAAPQAKLCDLMPQLIERLTQPALVQEPAAVVSGYYGGQCVILPTDPARLFNSGTAFYTATPSQPVAHPVIAGALFDFMGWLPSRKETLVLSSTNNASPAVETITEFAKMRGLSLDGARVQDWQDNTTLPAQQKPWVDLSDEEIDALAELHGLGYMSYAPFTQALEQRLKEKNHG